MATRQTNDIKRRTWKVLYRPTAAFTPPGDIGQFNTLLATFTEVGYVLRSSIEAPINKGGVELLDDGNEYTVSYDINLKFDALQTGASEITEYEGLQGDLLDLLFYAPGSGRAIFYRSVIVHILDFIKGGETDRFRFEIVKKDQPNLTAIRYQFGVAGI